MGATGSCHDFMLLRAVHLSAGLIGHGPVRLRSIRSVARGFPGTAVTPRRPGQPTAPGPVTRCAEGTMIPLPAAKECGLSRRGDTGAEWLVRDGLRFPTTLLTTGWRTPTCEPIREFVGRRHLFLQAHPPQTTNLTNAPWGRSVSWMRKYRMTRIPLGLLAFRPTTSLTNVEFPCVNHRCTGSGRC